MTKFYKIRRYRESKTVWATPEQAEKLRSLQDSEYRDRFVRIGNVEFRPKDVVEMVELSDKSFSLYDLPTYCRKELEDGEKKKIQQKN